MGTVHARSTCTYCVSNFDFTSLRAFAFLACPREAWDGFRQGEG